jgi:hypothetical protein
MKESLVLERMEAGIREGSAFIAQDIASNIERYGISPVIAIDGKIKNLRPKLIDNSEVEDFPKLLKKYGYNLEDFYLLETNTTKYNKNKTVLSSGGIICICKKSGKIKEYKANHGSSWIINFTADLKEKSFE